MTTQPNPSVQVSTSFGDFSLELYPQQAPFTVANFLQYVEDEFYHGTVFHRIIVGFMIQGGGFLPGLKQKSTRAPIVNEAKNGLHNQPYTIAMARTSVVDSATAQFFINVADNAFLNHSNRDFGYCVFGGVTAGHAVIDRIAGVSTHSTGGMSDVPVNDILIHSMKRC
ncbi:MAG: peptidylprolyl isomerase [Gammaproteobacteria bacterium]|nr:peptidylprolyl isomerase [Gammaproteobacteria bacterium]